MKYGTQIPAWAYAKKAQIEPSQEMVRYRGVMTYEVRVPRNPNDPQSEQMAAEQAASELHDKIWKMVGDDIPTYNPPEKLQ